MKLRLLVFVLVGLCALQNLHLGTTRVLATAQTQLSVTAVNRLKVARPSETIELSAKAKFWLSSSEAISSLRARCKFGSVRRLRYRRPMR